MNDPVEELTEDPVFPPGPYKVWANARRAEIRRKGRVLLTFTGEMAWADAVREAGDMNRERKK